MAAGDGGAPCTNVDVIVIGGGIVGASCAWALSRKFRVAILEAEGTFGYHATGRSAALYSEYFGDPAIKALTAGSRHFLLGERSSLPGGPFLHPRGTVAMATRRQLEAGEVDAILADHARSGLSAERVSLDRIRRMFPVLAEPEYAVGIYRPGTWDIDVAGLLGAFLRVASRNGAVLVANVRLEALTSENGRWRAIGTVAGRRREWRAPAVVNAAGAWGDQVARLAGLPPIGLEPRRRTVVRVNLPSRDQPPPVSTWPMLTELSDGFYFKPESGGLILCPCDSTPAPPTDARPEELDVAVAVAQLERMSGLVVPTIVAKWAGLRTFAPNNAPVIGADPATEGFIWAVGVGGAGIQTAPAVGCAVGALIKRRDLPDFLKRTGLTKEALAPERMDGRGDPISRPAVAANNGKVIEA